VFDRSIRRGLTVLGIIGEDQLIAAPIPGTVYLFHVCAI
jgi:hypothetical protein